MQVTTKTHLPQGEMRQILRDCINMELVAVLCDIRSLHNVASIFRTADGAGVNKIFLCGITPTPLDRFKKVRQPFAKVALGAESFLAWEKKSSVTECVHELKKDGYAIIAVEQTPASKPYDQTLSAIAAANPKLALVIGNEVNGLKPAIIKLADHVIEIPMLGRKESLNVAVAFGVVAFETRKNIKPTPQ